MKLEIAGLRQYTYLIKLFPTPIGMLFTTVKYVK